MKKLIVVLAVAMAFAAVPPADAQSPTLQLSLGPPASFGAFTPCVFRSYAAGTVALVSSTAGETTLTVHDATGIGVGHLVNGPSILPQPLQARAESGVGAGSGLAPIGGLTRR